jgi:alkanesulfonate monooxygenase SsuD/methylene tetrahydromethanopterin reductase-like flavin-dependent oxidoreductase (luciferase family)
MRFGFQVMNANLYSETPLYEGRKAPSDAERIEADLSLVDRADSVGFDTVWGTEHHFSPYMTTPNLCQYLTYVAGRTRNVDLGTGVIVLPWHDPVRVAEEIAMLDIVMGDRTLFLGFGRGASMLEFSGFRVPMDESRARYNEALEIVRRALSQERFSFEGEFFNIPEMTTYPRPKSPDLLSRMYCAWFSPSSLELAARSGVGALFAVMRDLDDYPAEVARFNGIRAEAGLNPMQAKVHSFVYCAPTRAQAEEEGVQHVQEYYDSIEEHYHWSDEKYRQIGSYEFYADLGQQRETATPRESAESLIKNCLFGTPDDIVQKVEALSQASQCDEVLSPFLYGRMPFERAEAQFRLFSSEALPRIQKLPTPQP